MLDAYKGQLDSSLRQASAVAEEARLALALGPLELVAARPGIESRLADARAGHARVVREAVHFRGVRLRLDAARLCAQLARLGRVGPPPRPVLRPSPAATRHSVTLEWARGGEAGEAEEGEEGEEGAGVEGRVAGFEVADEKEGREEKGGGQTRYSLEMRLVAKDAASEFRQVYAGDASRHVCAGLARGSRYQFRVRAEASCGGPSPYSETLEVATRDAVAFSTQYKGTRLTLANDNRSVTKDASNARNAAVLGDTSVDSYSVRLVATCNNLMIGFATTAVDVNGSNFLSSGFYFYTSNGNLYGQGGVSGAEYAGGACSTNGTVITANWDRQARTISFSVNGTSRGVAAAFRDVPGDGLFPAFNPHDGGCTFEFVDQ